MKKPTFFTAAVLTAAIALTFIVPPTTPTAYAATPMSGSANGKAGSGGVTSGRFVKLSAAGTIVASSAVTDMIVGVCERTAAANAATRWAPVGTMTTVTSGEANAVGDLLTSGTGGKSFVLDTDDASTQRVAAIALTAASDADETVTVIVAPSVAEQRLTLGGAVVISGANTFTTGTGAVSLNGDVTVAAGKDIGMSGAATFTTGTGAISLNGDVTVAANKDIGMSGTATFTTGTGAIALNGDVTVAANMDIGMSGTATFTTGTGAISLNGDVTVAADMDIGMSGTGTFTTGTGAIALNGDVTVAAGMDISLAAGAGYVEANGTTSGGIRIDPIDTGTAITTVQNSNGAAGTLTLPLGTDTLVARDTTDTLTNKTVDGDDNTVQDLGVGVPKVMTAVDDSTVGIPFIVFFEPAAAGNLDYTVPTGKKLRVLDAWYFKTVGNGAHASDELTLSNNGANPIFVKEELNGVNDGVRGEFDTLDDGFTDVVAANVLRLIALEDAAGGCDARIYVLCVWVTP